MLPLQTIAKRTTKGVSIQQLSVSNVRNLAAVEFDFDAGANVITGSNGAGKTSVLEAIHVLAHGRSFRAGRPLNLIRNGEDALQVRGEIQGTDGRSHHLAVERGASHRLLRVDRAPVEKMAAVAAYLPLLLFEPHSHQLVEGGPEQRRRMLDWGLFHVEQGFLETWRAYQRALRQRNQALRNQDRSGARDWIPVLARHGEALGKLRAGYVQMIEQTLPRSMQRLAPELEGLAVGYRQGWSDNMALDQALNDHEAQDLTLGYTTSGPHRADIAISLNQRQAARRLSRGQEKLVAIGLLMTQVEWFVQHTDRCPVLLLDDLPSELDAAHLRRTVEACAETHCQIFATALDWPAAFDAWQPGARLFHVEQGSLRQML